MTKQFPQGPSQPARGLVPAFLLIASVSSLASVSPAAAQEQPSFVVTTDTPQYCVQLAREVVARQARAQDAARFEVQHLLAEGRDMCDRGLIRGGIARLRRALVMLRHRPAQIP